MIMCVLKSLVIITGYSSHSVFLIKDMEVWVMTVT